MQIITTDDLLKWKYLFRDFASKTGLCVANMRQSACALFLSFCFALFYFYWYLFVFCVLIWCVYEPYYTNIYVYFDMEYGTISCLRSQSLNYSMSNLEEKHTKHDPFGLIRMHDANIGYIYIRVFLSIFVTVNRLDCT